MGPLTLLDFVGLDTTYRIAEIMFTEYREQRYAPPPLLKRMVLAGMNGRKSGRGFYDYSVDPPRVIDLGVWRPHSNDLLRNASACSATTGLAFMRRVTP